MVRVMVMVMVMVIAREDSRRNTKGRRGEGTRRKAKEVPCFHSFFMYF
jgi:hypothetical protein